MATKTRSRLDVRSKLLELLGDVDRPGQVCMGRDLPLTMPGLEVEGLGAIRLPLGKTQARKLIKLCRQAPYGKGTETLVDTDVRRVWELDPEQFRLTNPRWDDLVASILADVQQELGLENRKLKAHLYKLLVYEEGGFFLPHRDGEKLDRMVATLVISLPAVHEGGELVVSHDGRQHEIVFGGAASGHELSYAAFYADCRHEIQPLRSGYRLCLTYSVSLAKSRSKKGIAAPSFGATATAIGELLGDWRADPDSRKIAITLDHRYTQDGLTVDKLKGVDRARAEVLFEAADQADCVAHLALVTLWQSGLAEGAYDERYSRRRRSRWYDDDFEDEDETSSGKYVMGEIYDESLSADHWSDQEGRKVQLGEIEIQEDELVAATALDDWEPNEEDFEGYTGNAGMTLERWYHRAAVVIWPREKHFDVLCGAGTDAAIGGLAPLVGRLKRAAKSRRDEQRRECLEFAAAIIDAWQPHQPHTYHRTNADQAGRTPFSALLCELDDPDLVRRFLSQVMTCDGEVQVDNSFAKFCKQHGWRIFEAELTAIVETATAAAISRNAELLRTLCLCRDKNEDRIELCRRLCESAVGALVMFDKQPPGRDWRVHAVHRSVFLVSLVKSMLAVGAEQPLRRIIDHALGSDRYDLTEAHLAAIFRLESTLAKQPMDSVSHWLSECRRELENRTDQPSQKPTNYRRPHELSCRCRDCKELSRFLADPDEREGRFPMAKERRRHLHQIIERNRCDVTHVTERRGSPYILVCTKTTASYDEACRIYERDLANLSRIAALETKIGQRRT